MLVVIKARDPETLSRFYSALGLQFVRRRHGREAGSFATSIGASLLEIHPRTSETDDTSATRIGFTVPDLDFACARAISRNGTLVRAAERTPLERRAVISDPEGHTVEILERAARDVAAAEDGRQVVGA